MKEPYGMSRRRFLVGVGGVGLAAWSARRTWAQVGMEVPAGAADCHVHVFDGARFPFAAKRSYTPGPATVNDLRAHLDGLGIGRTVLVQPSVYGTDNRCLLDALRQLGPEVARAIAVVDPAVVSDQELAALTGAGVVGLRINLAVQGEDRGAAAVEAVSKATARVADHGLVVQIFADMPLLEALEETIATAPVPVVLDHFAGAKAAEGTGQPGFAALERLLADGRVWVKLSAPYRASELAPNYGDLQPIVEAMVAANPDRLVWASDWPHTGGGRDRAARKPTDIEPFREIDDAHVLRQLAVWVPDPAQRRKILVDNAATLFRF
jgi:predicted TIM-barrel fold metal-dependent hydrolase